jgi:hypothetical protein
MPNIPLPPTWKSTVASVPQLQRRDVTENPNAINRPDALRRYAHKEAIYRERPRPASLLLSQPRAHRPTRNNRNGRDRDRRADPAFRAAATGACEEFSLPRTRAAAASTAWAGKPAERRLDQDKSSVDGVCREFFSVRSSPLEVSRTGCSGLWSPIAPGSLCWQSHRN